MSWLALARLELEQLGGRFEAFEVSEPADYQACAMLLDAVRRTELRRLAGASAFEVSGFDDSRARSILLAVRDRRSGLIVGCVRGIFASSVADQAQARREYRLDLVPAALLEHTGIAARMVVAPEYRKSAASLALTRALYRVSLRKYAMQLFLLSCEPALLAMYQRMGYRAIGPVWAKHCGGFRIPMVLVGYDQDQLAWVKSPLLPELREIPQPWPREGLRWFAETQRQLPADPGLRRFAAIDHPALTALTSGMSSKGRRELLANAMEVDAHPGDLAHREGDGVPGLAVVLRGSVELRSKDVVLARLGPGSVLGVVTTTLDRPRSADAVVIEDHTKLLLLSRSATARVRRAGDRAALWHNLAQLLATRITLSMPGERANG